MKRDTFVYYRSFYEATKLLDNDDFAEITRAICEYALNGNEPSIEGVPMVVFKLIKPQIDANNAKFLNGGKGGGFGQLGGRPRKETPTKPQQNPKETPKKPQQNPKETPNEECIMSNEECIMSNDNIVSSEKTKKNIGADAPTNKKSIDEIEIDLEKRNTAFYNTLVPFIETYGKEMLRDFYNYWSEPQKSRKKMRFELEKTWEVKRRLEAWNNRQIQKNNGSNRKNDQDIRKQIEHNNEIIKKAVEVGFANAGRKCEW